MYIVYIYARIHLWEPPTLRQAPADLKVADVIC
jgi:hypothetical protein